MNDFGASTSVRSYAAPTKDSKFYQQMVLTEEYHVLLERRDRDLQGDQQ